MNARLLFILLLFVIGALWYIIGYWRRKAGEAAFAAARLAEKSDARESLHEAKGGEKRILERNYLITGNIKGKEIIIIDDVLTTGQSVADYKEEIERCGGKVVAAIFYGKTFSMPSMLLVQIHIWGNHIAHIIERMTK